jgi:hypothetical protein
MERPSITWLPSTLICATVSVGAYLEGWLPMRFRAPFLAFFGRYRQRRRLQAIEIQTASLNWKIAKRENH